MQERGRRPIAIPVTACPEWLVNASRAAPWPFYAWYGTAGGVTAVVPWLSLHLDYVGLSASAIGLVLLALPLGRLLGTPVWGWFADRLSPALILRLSSGFAVVAVVGILLSTHPVAVSALVFLWALSLAIWYPIVDVATVREVGRGYGRVRVAASIAFLVCVQLNGALRDQVAWAPMLVSTIMTLMATAMAFRLPVAVAPPKPPSLAALASLARHRSIWPLLLAATLHGATLSSYDLLFAPHVSSLGASGAAIGMAFALGVAVEVCGFLASPWLLKRISPAGWMALGLGAGIPRFLVTGLSEDVPLLIGIQALHGIHFGAFWLAGTLLFAERAPPELRNTTQALFPAATFGAGPLLGLGMATWWLRTGSQSDLYLIMAATSALALAAFLLAPRPASG